MQIEIVSDILSFFVLLLGLWTKAITVAWKIVSCHWHGLAQFCCMWYSWVCHLMWVS